ncbi:MAG: helix-turn-helix transcriptional regulator [Labilithrix sp.]
MGDAWIYFCVDAGLYGFALWGTPAAEDMAALVSLLTVELDRVPHVAIVDVRDLEAALTPSFEALAGYFFEHAATLAERVTRSVIVKGKGMTAAIAAGFMETVPPTFHASLASELTEALTTLGRADASEVAAAIDAAKNEARGTPGFVRTLQSWLDAHLEGSIDDAAHALALATRTLQRRLTEASTSFAEQGRLARVRAAKRLLVETDAPITTIAIDVGCSSPQHLSTLFKQYVGQTPSEWRASARGSRSPPSN